MAGDKAAFEAAIKKGDSLAWAGRWEESLAEFTRAIKESPDSVLGHRSLGMAYARCGRYAESLTEYEAVLAQVPNNLVIHGKIADMRGKLGRLDQLAEGHLQIADAYLKEHNFDRAIASWRHILATMPGQLEARLRLAEALDRGGYPEEAAAEYRELARRAKETDQPGRALEWAKKAYETNPSDREIEIFYQSLQAPPAAPSQASPVEESVGLERLVLTPTPAREALPNEPDRKQVAREKRTKRPQSDPEVVLGQAMATSAEYLVRGLFAAAIDECLAAIETDPAFLPAQVRLAEIYARLGRVDDAITKYDTLAAVYLVRGQPDDSVQMYRRLLALAPKNTGVRKRLAQLLLDLERADEAAEEYLKVAGLDLSDGNTVVTQDELEKILEAAASLLDRDGKSPLLDSGAFWIAMGRMLREQGAPEMALDCFEKARLGGGRRDPRVLLNLGDLYALKRRWSDALRVYRELKTILPNDETPLLKCAEVLFKSGHVSASLAEFDALAEFQLSSGDPARALATAQIMRQIAPQSAVPRLRLSQIYATKGLVSEAIGELFALAQLRREQGNLKDAETVYRRILLLDPRRRQVYLQLGELLATSGKIADAQQAYQKALELDPTDDLARQRLSSIQRPTVK